MKIEQKNISKELDLPEYIRNIRTPPLHSDQDYEQATFFFNGLYNNIASARFELIQGNKEYHENIIKNESGEKGQYWLRFQFLKNSIIWYNSSLDILYQVLWFGYALYRNAEIKHKNKKVKINTIDSIENFSILLENCKLFKIKSILKNYDSNDTKNLLKQIEEFQKNITQKNVRKWANSLKHHGNFELKELYVSGLGMKIGRYQTTNTKPIIVNIDEIISTLKEYHISFCKLLKYIFDFFDFETMTKCEFPPNNSEKLYKKIIIKEKKNNKI